MALILLVDDDPNTITTLAGIIWQLNRPIKLLTARNGQEAVDLINHKPVDILITNFMIADTTGLILIKKLQQDGCAPPYIVLLTDHELYGHALTANSRFGIDHYLVKPVLPTRILPIIRQALDR